MKLILSFFFFYLARDRWISSSNGILENKVDKPSKSVKECLFKLKDICLTEFRVDSPVLKELIEEI